MIMMMRKQTAMLTVDKYEEDDLADEVIKANDELIQEKLRS